MLGSTKCPFSDKDCPVLNKNVDIAECPMAFGHKDARECSFSFIARNLDGIYQILHQWFVDWRKANKVIDK